MVWLHHMGQTRLVMIATPPISPQAISTRGGEPSSSIRRDSLLNHKHLVGIAAAAGIFGMFGLMIGNVVAAFTGVVYGDPIQKLATGETLIPIADITNPLGATPQDIGLAADTALVLPGIPVSVEIGGMSLSVAGMTLAQVTGGGGALFGAILGLYYALDIAWEQRKEQHGEGPSAE